MVKNSQESTARHRRSVLASLCCTWLGLSVPAMAQPASYPAHPVRIVSVSGAGTGVDDFTRLAATYLSRKTGQNFYVENRPGANSILASDHVAKAVPDGYTLLLTAASAVTANPYLYKKLPYDANKDLVPIARMSVVPIVVMVPATSPYRSMEALMAGARAQPGKLSYGTSTTGYKVMVAAINGLAKVQALEIPYKSSAALLPDLISGTLDYAMLEVSQAVPQVEGGKLRALAVSSPMRVAALPDVPTLNELGLGDATLTSWLGLFAPAGTPRAVVDKLSLLAVEFVSSPEANRHFTQRGTAAYPAASGEFAKAILDDQARWKHYITTTGLQPE
ncbi:Bug family tripartite tricarboxylate transporter substrate binding protein [Variovorax sp. PAMC26660]|uniref:Bug family tripartite tricarboxylate transporter substrate binding protein n=1 Tax=Variovorax sp. PAMC26660 TaxID=2762322 RepID=UPI0021C318D4|nr:tripartite tricarboxylate transporter substrate binding protein [Variovorax sp. PAMC26660]